MKITVLNQYDSLEAGLEWDDVPPFAILTGVNGVGKSQLLRYIHAYWPSSDRICNAPCPRDDVSYISSDWRIDGINPLNVDQIEDYIRKDENSLILYFENKYLHAYDDVANHNMQYERILIEIKEKLNKVNIKDLTRDEILNNISTIANNELKGIEDYKIYFLKYMKNIQKRLLLAIKDDDQVAAVKEVLNTKAPWDMINELLRTYGFKHQMKEPKVDSDFENLFFVDKAGKDIPLASLSSGEKMLIALVMWAHNPQTSRQIRYMLLDEADAFLHPSLSELFMDILYNTIHKYFGIGVLLISHSPSTIAFSPDGCVYVMHDKIPRIRKQSKSEAIKTLSKGMIALRQDDAVEILEYSIEGINKPIVCVEGVFDKKILLEAWWKLYNNSEMPFYIIPSFDCYFITNMFLRDDIFINYPDNIFIGLIDFDSAFTNWLNKSNGKYDKINIANGFAWKSKKYKGVVVPLAIPEMRSDYAGYNITNSYMTIEHLFTNEVIKEYCENMAVAGGVNLLKFKDAHKKSFASSVVPELPCSAFIHFEDVFKNILESIELCR